MLARTTTLTRSRTLLCARRQYSSPASTASSSSAAAGANAESASRRTSARDMASLSAEHHAMIGSMLRVNQAGEIGANWIYKGQLAVLGRDPKTGPMLQHMLDQEVHHLETFNKLIPEFRARPSALYPVWQAAGFVVGVGSALLGKRAAMACTEAVETVIGNHYNDQLRTLIKTMSEDQELRRKDDIKQLAQTIKEFRDDELEHLDTAVEQEAKSMVGYPIFNKFIQTGCKVAIQVAKRV